MDLGGVKREFELIRPATLQVIDFPENQGAAFLFSNGEVAVEEGRLNLKLGKGTLWIRTGLFTQNSADKTFTGFPIAEGQGKFQVVPAGSPTFPRLPSASPTVATLAPPLIGSLELRLAYASSGPTAFPEISLAPPTQLTIKWDGETTFTLEGGQAKIGETQLSFSSSSEAVVLSDTNNLLFQCKIAPDRFDAASVPSVAQLEGFLGIGSAGWAVPTTTKPANTLPMNSGAGGWFLSCQGDVALTWSGLQGRATLQNPDIEIATDGFVFGTQTALVEPNTDYPLELWALPTALGDSQQYQPFSLSLANASPLMLGCNDSRGNYIAFMGMGQAALSRPVDIQGRPLLVSATQISGLISEREGDRQISFTTVRSRDDTESTIRFALENALVDVDQCRFHSFNGTLENDVRLSSGGLTLQMRALSWLPTLPDPYVANVSPIPRDGGRETLLSAAVRWDADAVQVRFSGILARPDLNVLPESPPGSKPGLDRDPDNIPQGGLTQSGQQLRSPREEKNWQTAIDEVEERLSDPPDISRTAADVWTESSTKLVDLSASICLLDVSTNRDQIGVRLVLKGSVGESAGDYSFVVEGMQIGLPLPALRVFALPQIQWEPVRTLDVDQNLTELGYFPTPLASADDGGPTVIASDASARRFAPAIPDLTLRDMVEAFAAGDAINLVTTLPFGMKALMALRPKASDAQQPDQIRYTQPSFRNGQGLQGGIQLTLQAGFRTVPSPSESPGFEGLTVQFLNGVDLRSGIPLNISVLGATQGASGSVETLFNQEFALAQPRVPVTRLDISGYGTSTFSDWGNPFAAFAQASKVQFQVMVGRTALEVVKVVSVCYPWGIRLTRSITIERGAGAGVLRRDSGWQASSDGLFDFRYQEEGNPTVLPSPYEVHPGLIRGVFNVNRIRPADRPPMNLPAGGRVLPIYFDAEIEIGTDSQSQRTPVKGLLGYLHLAPVGEPITPGELATLIETYGPIGGPVDTQLGLDTSGFRCRLLRVEAGLARDVGVPVVVGVVRGTPQFGPAGAWAVGTFPGPGNPSAPQEADLVNDGVPIIREGRSGEPENGRVHVPSPSSDILLADAVDLFAAGSPWVDYAFIQTTPTHAFAFRRPFIRVGSQQIEAGLAPCFADIVARTTGAGLFPAISNAIQLTDTSYQLLVSPATGFFKLDPSITLSIARPELKLSDDADVGVRLAYDAATLMLDIGETEWAIDMPGLAIQTDIFGVSDVSGLNLSIIGGTQTRPQLVNLQTRMQSTVEDILTFIPGFSNREPLPPVDLGATNVKFKAKLKTVAKEDFKIASFLYIRIFAEFEAGTDELDIPPDLSLPGSAGGKAVVPFVGGSIGLDLRGETPTFPWRFVYGCILELGGKAILPSFDGSSIVGVESKPLFQLTVYIGAGFGGEVGPFKALVVVGLGPTLIYDGSWVVGGYLFFDANVDALIAGVRIYGEFVLAIAKLSDGDYARWAGEVGINIKVAWVISIKMSVKIVGDEKI